VIYNFCLEHLKENKRRNFFSELTVSLQQGQFCNLHYHAN